MQVDISGIGEIVVSGLRPIDDDPAQRDGLAFHFCCSRNSRSRSPRRCSTVTQASRSAATLAEHVALGALQAAAHIGVGKTATCPFWRSLPSVTRTDSGNFPSFGMRKT
jgi:hypothetical protein